MNFILLAVVGAAVGFLATRLLRIEASLPMVFVIGVGGAIIGSVLVRFMLEITGWVASFGGAIAGSVLLLWIWNAYIRDR